MTKMFYALAGVLVAAFFSGCGKPGAASDVYGTYLADYDVAKEELTLNNDNTYSQKVIIKATGKTDTHNGKWKLDVKNGYITFDGNFMLTVNGAMQFDPDYLKPKNGLITQPIGRVFGTMEIGSSEGVVFKKR